MTTPLGRGQFSDYRRDLWLSEYLNGSYYLGLVTEDPNSAVDPLAAEVTGSTYRRPLVYFTAYNRLLSLSSSELGNAGFSWPGIPAATTVVGAALWDAPYLGNLEASVLFDSAVSFPTGGTYTLPDNTLWIGIDAI